MEIWKTEKEVLSAEDILKYIADYEKRVVPRLDDMWGYYKAENPPILARKSPDANNPDNRTVVSYGRKIVTTFQGYAYRPRYVTYKSDSNEAYGDALQEIFDDNTEHIKTSRAGRNTAIFGLSYELVYIDGENGGADVRFFTVDPREMILLYDFSPEPKKQLAIRYYRINPSLYKVEVYYKDRVETYDRFQSADYMEATGGWKLRPTGSNAHFFGAVPVVAYYMGDEIIGLIYPVKTLIDDYDLLLSDSLNEFDRFAHAYLILKKMSLTNPQLKKDANTYSRALKLLKRRRVFENVPAEGDVSFLTKDIASDFITFLTDTVRNEIHKQTHVPDFMSERLGGDLSGAAVQRLMFDFENLVSSAEGDFDVGLTDRISLITRAMTQLRIGTGDPQDITISHKRNTPVNVMEFAEIARIMKDAGFSRYLIADIMPDDIVPDVELELQRQDEDRESMFADIEGAGMFGAGDDETEE